MIAGQIPRGQIGKDLGGIHEILDQSDVVRNVTKWRRQVLTPRDVPDAVREAFRQMRTGRAKLIQHVSKLPRTVPQEGLISP